MIAVISLFNAVQCGAMLQQCSAVLQQCSASAVQRSAVEYSVVQCSCAVQQYSSAVQFCSSAVMHDTIHMCPVHFLQVTKPLMEATVDNYLQVIFISLLGFQPSLKYLAHNKCLRNKTQSSHSRHGLGDLGLSKLFRSSSSEAKTVWSRKSFK